VKQFPLERNGTMAKLSRIAPELPVSNLHEAIEHYERKLGFHIAMQMPEGDYAIVERDDALYAEFQRRGGHLSQGIARKPWGNRDFGLNDGSGNEIKFTEPLSQNESGQGR
jgi:uncharacterized glyoxalase superfamily protein PhnB